MSGLSLQCVSLLPACACCMLWTHARLPAGVQTESPCLCAAIAQAASSGNAQAAASALATAQSSSSGVATFAQAIAQVVHLAIIPTHNL